MRKHLSSELGFSKEHRDLNILRIGFVATEITKNGGIALCAPIAPYASIRGEVRELVERPRRASSRSTSRPRSRSASDATRKGLYAKARAGLIKEFTGIDDPYEAPEHPECVIDTEAEAPDIAAHRILLKLEGLGLIR